jgi:hypothetical protein
MLRDERDVTQDVKRDGLDEVDDTREGARSPRVREEPEPEREAVRSRSEGIPRRSGPSSTLHFDY